MAFTCNVCDFAQKPGTKPKMQVVSTRKKRYPARKHKAGYDMGGCGYETVKEIKVCPKCITGHVTKMPN